MPRCLERGGAVARGGQAAGPREEGGRPLMVIRRIALILSIVIVGGCAMKAPRVPVAIQDGAIADLGPNSPWNPEFAWLSTDPAETIEPAGQDQLAELLEDSRVVRRAAELARSRWRSIG